jgi:hypothetical protein
VESVQPAAEAPGGGTGGGTEETALQKKRRLWRDKKRQQRAALASHHPCSLLDVLLALIRLLFAAFCLVGIGGGALADGEVDETRGPAG